MIDELSPTHELEYTYSYITYLQAGLEARSFDYSTSAQTPRMLTQVSYSSGPGIFVTLCYARQHYGRAIEISKNHTSPVCGSRGVQQRCCTKWMDLTTHTPRNERGSFNSWAIFFPTTYMNSMNSRLYVVRWRQRFRTLSAALITTMDARIENGSVRCQGLTAVHKQAM